MGFVGVETEYGIAVTGPEEVHPVRAAALLVAAHRDLAGGDVGWDYTEERPDRDARATPVRPEPPELRIGEPDVMNLVLTNGARLYVDHAHPEYATPECTSARDLVVWDVAGERIVEAAARHAESFLPPGSTVHVHKNNTDGKGAAYGTHENYLLDRDVPFGLLTRHLLPMFVSRPVLVGAGRVGSDSDPSVVYQLSQRADFFVVEIGLETTYRRPIMNTRDEPHADADRFRRLHVINGDANMSEVANAVKVGTMMLLLDAIVTGALPDPIELDDAVAAFRTFSHDPTLRATVRAGDGRRWSALDLQEEYLERVTRAIGTSIDGAAAAVIERWGAMIAAGRDDPGALVGLADWATKLDLIEAFRARHGLDPTHDRVRMVDLQFHDVRREKGLHHRLAAAGRVERLTTEDEVLAAMGTPPPDTRAWFRGECIRRFPEAVVAAGWDSVVLDLGPDRGLVRLPMPDPGLGTRELTAEALEQATDVLDLLRRLEVREELPGQLA